jgi:hypothetical protein
MGKGRRIRPPRDAHELLFADETRESGIGEEAVGLTTSYRKAIERGASVLRESPSPD